MVVEVKPVGLSVVEVSMGLGHCPLCIGLAVLCAVRASAHALLLWRLA